MIDWSVDRSICSKHSKKHLFICLSGTLDQRWNDILDLNQVASILDDMECLFDELEEQLRRSKEGETSVPWNSLHVYCEGLSGDGE